ncbi:MAG: DinB family protein [Bacteroidetes bacterium]|nr:DinB family protein [Bacteroidota bacterium]
MKKTLRLAVFAFIGLAFYFPVAAQGINADSVKAQLIKDWQRAKDYTDEYLKTMPADKYGARPVDSIRSFAEQMLHLSMGNEGLIVAATGSERIFNGRNIEKAPGAQSRDSVMYFVDASYDFAINSIKKLDASKLGERVSRGKLNETRLTWIMKAFEHQTHHRGQCTIIIRLQGIRPPNERLF